MKSSFAVFLSLALLGCRGPNPEVGRVDLTLALGAPGFSSATYSVQVEPALEGEVRFADGQRGGRATVEGVPVGARVVAASASNSAGLRCAAEATVTVTANQTTPLHLTVPCTTPAERCAKIIGVSAVPLAAVVGSSIALSADVLDADPSSVPTFAWKADAGTLAATANASFACTAPGEQSLAFAVTDGECQTASTIGVTCIPPYCGNATVEAGEQCEPPGTATCSIACQTIVPAVCGNNQVETGEDCDPPKMDRCTAQCQSVCKNCLRSKCADAFDICESGSVRESCEQVAACIATTHCNQTNITDCYCGAGVTPGACTQPGGARGLCKTQIETAAKTTSPTVITANYFNSQTALGNAINLASCRQTECPVLCE
jgi:hypothetical protein